MPNAFSKEEIVMFEDTLEGFEDNLVASKIVTNYKVDPVVAERTNDAVWIPQPYIAQSHDGTDATSTIDEFTQLSVPVTIGYQKHSAFSFTSAEYRDAVQSGRMSKAARQKLASDINYSIMNVASLQGTVVVVSASASSSATAGSTGFDLVADCDAAFNEQGVAMNDRYMILGTRDYNGMASNLAARTLMDKSATAYERAYIGPVAGFDTYKGDYAISCVDNATGGTTIGAADQYYTPVATQTAATGESSNVDNRYQTLTVASTTGVTAGDSFTIADVYSVHHITKQSTGQLKTFRVISVASGTTMVISPAIVSGGGGTDAELQYQNVDSTPANGAAVTFLNLDDRPINPFWHADAMYLIPGTIAIDENSSVAVMRERTEQGIELVYQKWVDGLTQKTFCRWDTKYGVADVQPEMSGILLFNQA